MIGSVFLNQQMRLFQYALGSDTEPFNICYALSKRRSRSLLVLETSHTLVTVHWCVSREV